MFLPELPELYIQVNTDKTFMSNIILDLKEQIICDAIKFAFPKYNNIPYHNWGHVRKLFSRANLLNITLTWEQKIAIIFHDVDYIPCTKDNEERAVKIFKEFATNVIGNPSIEKIERIIMDTKDQIPRIEDSKNVLELDLFDLGTTDRYYTNSDLIKKECLTKVSLEEYEYGRRKFFEKLLVTLKDSIWMKYMNREQAIINIEKDLSQ